MKSRSVAHSKPIRKLNEGPSSIVDSRPFNTRKWLAINPNGKRMQFAGTAGKRRPAGLGKLDRDRRAGYDDTPGNRYLNE